MAGGTIISLLVFGLMLSLFRTRDHALQKAKQLTAELRESEEKYRIIFNNEIYAICIFDLNTFKLLDVNEAYTRLYGYSRDELVSGMTIHDITAEHQASDAAAVKATKEGTTFIPLRYHRKKNGTVFPVEIVGGPYEWKGQKVMFALAHDISVRNRAEEALLKSNAENRNLLGELQHRVKNSFNMITSLINLTSSEEGSPEIQAILANLDSRVRSISELYSLLYSSGSFSEVRLDDYCARVARPLVGLTGGITLQFESTPIIVPAKIAAPFGLIVTELITNAIKYAFPDERKGVIAVTLRTTGSGAVLSVEDDGIGLPAGFDPAGASGMGLSMVEALSSQINGSFKLEGGPAGTRASVEFSIPRDASPVGLSVESNLKGGIE